MGKKIRKRFYIVFRMLIFRWSDNTLVDYSKWGSGNPANDQQKQCAVLGRASVWASVHCWNLLPLFVKNQHQKKTRNEALHEKILQKLFLEKV